MKIATVMVTYNRLVDLKKAICTYEQQSLLPQYMIIVDNCSTDGTREYLDEWKKKKSEIQKIVIHLPSNIGGSGGFYEGLKYAQTTDAQWYWIADDDAFLKEDVFYKLYDFEMNNPQIMKNVVALCSAVVEDQETNRFSICHRRRNKVAFGCPKENVPAKEEYADFYFEIDLFTFVGSMVKADASKKAGLPIRDFFIYHDDIEYSYRISKEGKMLCVPGAIVFHNTAAHEDAYGTTWRSYYMSRNWLMYYKWHFPVAYYRIVLKRYLQRILLKLIGKYQIKNQLDFDAMLDARKNKLGISEKYYIGWKA